MVPAEELLPICRQLAQDMLSLDPATLVSYKRLLDDGHVLPFGADMALEAQVAVMHNNIDPAAIEERRRALLARGRVQSNSWAARNFAESRRLP